MNWARMTGNLLVVSDPEYVKINDTFSICECRVGQGKKIKGQWENCYYTLKVLGDPSKEWDKAASFRDEVKKDHELIFYGEPWEETWERGSEYGGTKGRKMTCTIERWSLGKKVDYRKGTTETVKHTQDATDVVINDSPDVPF